MTNATKPTSPKQEKADLPKELQGLEKTAAEAKMEFGEITMLASHICGTPMGMMRLMDETGHWLQAKAAGMPVDLKSGEMAFHAEAIQQPEVFVVEDARADSRFTGNTIVTGPARLRFYAGCRLMTPEGRLVGVLAVTDRVPKQLSSAQKMTLQTLCRQVVAQIQLREQIKGMRGIAEDLHKSNANHAWKMAFMDAQVNSSLDGILVVDEKGNRILQNQRLTDIFNIPPHITQDPNDEKQVEWVTSLTKDPDAFAARVEHLYANRDEVGRDEITLKDGTVLDRYSSPVFGKDGKYYGRIWTFRDMTASKAVVSSLRESEEKFRQLADNITDLFWIAAPDLSALHYVSAGYEVITGRSSASLYEQPERWLAIIHPDDRHHVLESFGQLAGSMPYVSTDYRMLHLDGSVRWVHGRGFQVKDSSGRVVRLTGIVTDITERKEAAESIARQQTELRALFDVMPAMVWFKDTKNGILRVNKRVAETLGRRVEEIEGHATSEFYAEADRFFADDLEVIQSGQPMLGIIETINGPDGREAWRRTDKVPCLDQDGKVTGIVVVSQDITERRRAEESLKLLGTAVRHCEESIVITDIHMEGAGPRILFVNPAYCRMCGYSEEELIGRPGSMLLGPQTDPSVLDRVREALHKGEVFSGEVVNYRKDGSQFIKEWQTAPIRDADGQVTHFVSVQRDVTERKKLEARLFESQKMETVGKLTGGIAHEFNSILTAIIGQTELLLGALQEGDKLAANAHQISKAAGRAATLTRQLLAYGRRQFLQPETLDLNKVVSGMESMFHHFLGGEVHTQFLPASDLQAVKADAGQIEQVVMNMVMNAADAMPNGGKLTLETGNITIDDESVGRYPDLKPGDYVVLSISDTGTGMSADVSARIFEPFFSTKEVGQGTGLGLSTCDGIIRQSGGHISVYSEQGRGSTFKVYLPQIETPAKSMMKPLQMPGLPRGQETILLVEDDPALREMAANLLGRLGYTVHTAANGVEALGIRQKRDLGGIDLLFTDLVMPHMSGKELSERMLTYDPRLKVLFTSAYTENAMIHQGVLPIGVALLQKPFAPLALASKLREVLDGNAEMSLAGAA